MAEIVVVGYVQEWKKESTDPHPYWGMKISEPHYKKEGEESVLASRTYFTVKAGWQIEIDFTKFKVGDKVKVVGKQFTEVRENAGKTYSSLIIRAETVELEQSGKSESFAQRALAEEPF
jgi:hypothetical protein